MNLDLPRICKIDKRKNNILCTTLNKRIEYKVQSTENPWDVLKYYKNISVECTGYLYGCKWQLDGFDRGR